MTTHQSFASRRALTTKLAARSRDARAEREASVEIAQVSRRNDPAPDIEICQRAIADLKPAKRKVRRIDPDHVAEVSRSIAAFGFTVPMLISGDGTIVDGHTRWEAAKVLDLETLPCVIVDHLSAEEQAALKLTVNRLGEKGSWDIDALKLEMEIIDTLEMDLTLTGFTLPEIDIILSTASSDAKTASAEVEDLQPSNGPAVSRIGDIWQLGPHRLLVGDATQAESYALLMAGETAACVFTDPPYNCPIAGFVTSNTDHKEFAMGVGEMSDDAFRDFLGTVLAHAKAVSMPGAVLYACMDWRQLHLLTLAGKDVGLTHINTAVWTKGTGGMGSLYRSAHEMVAVFANGDRPATNNVELGKHGRDRCNVWAYPSANRKGSSANKMLGAHPTPKPVELVRDALLDVTKRGDIIVDPFTGSGTTIMAAEACGRVGYGIELDLAYADLVVSRWQAATGQQAILAGTGDTFAAIKADRTATE